MIGKLSAGIAGLCLLVGCSMAAPGTRASAALKEDEDKDGKTIGTATLREQSGWRAGARARGAQRTNAGFTRRAYSRGRQMRRAGVH